MSSQKRILQIGYRVIASGTHFNDEVDIDYCFFFDSCEYLKLNFNTIKTATLQDKILCQIKRFIIKGWPKKFNDLKLKPFFAKKT